MADGRTWSLPGRRADQADPEYDAMPRVVCEGPGGPAPIET